MKKLLFLALLLGLAVPSYATTYYVSTTGLNTNNCTAAQSISTPKQTITNFLTSCTLAPGDTLYIRGGTYTETMVLNDVDGTVGNLITISSYQNEIVVIDPPAGPNSAISLTASSYIQIVSGQVGSRNIIADCFHTGGNTCVILVGQTGYTNVRLRDIEIKDAGRNDCGVGDFYCEDVPSGTNGLAAGGTFIELIHLWIHDNGESHFDHGAYMTGDDVLLEDSVIENNSGWGWHKYNVGDRHTIRRNTICNNGRSRLSGDPSGAGEGILLWGGTGSLVYNNIVCSNNSAGISINASEMNSEIYFNTVYGNAVGNSTGGIYDLSNDAIVKSNIIYGNTGTPLTGGGGGSSNNLTTDPSFMNAAGGEFHLATGSAALPPCGVTITGITADKDNVGRPNPPSCGAFEVPSGSNPTDPLAETFNTYSATASIDTLNGGSGWTTGWALINGTITVETAPAWMTTRSLRQNATAVAEARRFFTAHSGEFSIFYKMSISTTPNDYVVVSALAPSGAVICQVYFDPAGDLLLGDAALVLDSGIALDHAYAVEMNFDTANQPDKCRAKVDGGSYTAWTPTGASYTTIGGLQLNLYPTNAHTFWMDDISDESGGGSGTITVQTPAAGQTCFSGSACPITWTSNGLTGALDGLYYLVNGNDTPHLIASPDVTATPYSWTVNSPAGTTIVIRAKQGSVTDDSDQFTVFGIKAVFR